MPSSRTLSSAPHLLLGSFLITTAFATIIATVFATATILLSPESASSQTAANRPSANHPAGADNTATVNINPTPNDTLLLERITIVGESGRRNTIPGSAAYISAEQLQEHADSDVHRLLRSVAGVHLQEEDGFGLRPNIGMRGAASERSSKINLMEDGVLIAPAPYSAPSAYYFPNVRRMSGVEVRKGSSQIKYGPNTTGGSVNLISTPVPAEFEALAETGLGNFGAHQHYLRAGNRSGQTGFMAEGLFSGHNGFKNLQSGASTGYEIMDVTGKLLFRSAPEAETYQRMELKAGYNEQVSDETYLGLTRDDFSQSPYRRYAASQLDQMTTDHVQLMARHFVLFNEHADLTTTVYRNDFFRNWYKLQSVGGIGIGSVMASPDTFAHLLEVLRGVDAGSDDTGGAADNGTGTDGDPTPLAMRSNQRNYLSRGIESRFNVHFGTGAFTHRVEIGARLHYDEEDRFQREDLYRMESGTMQLLEEGEPGSQSNRVGSTTAGAFHIQHQIRWNRWLFTPGVRYEQIHFENRDYGTADPERTGSDASTRKYTLHEWIPGAGVTFELSPSVILLGGVHKGFSPPGPASDVQTRSEKSVQTEAGVRYHSTKVRTEFITFANLYSNLLGSDLQAAGGEGTSARFNAGKARILGVEMSASADVSATVAGRNLMLPLRMNYTYTHATFQSDFESGFSAWGDVNSGDFIPFVPAHQFNGSAGVLAGPLSVNLRVSASPGLRTAAGSGSPSDLEKTDAFVVADLSGEYGLMNGFSLFFHARNLLDSTYIVSDRPAGVRPGLPRSLMGGVKWRFD